MVTLLVQTSERRRFRHGASDHDLEGVAGWLRIAHIAHALPLIREL
jgi:hypothetical protein